MATINFTYDYPYTYYNEENGRFTWHLSTGRATLNGCYTYPIQFNSTVPKCSHITIELEVTNTGSVTVLGRDWDLYTYNEVNGWRKATKFTMPSDGKCSVDCVFQTATNISRLACVPSSDPGSRAQWSLSCSINRMTITEALTIQELDTGVFHYGVFLYDFGVKTDVAEVFVNMGGTLTKASDIFVNIDDELRAVSSVYSAYLKTETESISLYRFIPQKSGTYRIQNKLLSGDHEIRLYDSNFDMLDDNYFYSQSFPLEEGSVYYITMTHYYANTDTGESYLQIYKED